MSSRRRLGVRPTHVCVAGCQGSASPLSQTPSQHASLCQGSASPLSQTPSQHASLSAAVSTAQLGFRGGDRARHIDFVIALSSLASLPPSLPPPLHSPHPPPNTHTPPPTPPPAAPHHHSLRYDIMNNNSNHKSRPFEVLGTRPLSNSSTTYRTAPTTG